MRLKFYLGAILILILISQVSAFGGGGGGGGGPAATCGDAVINQASEECDDGNAVNTDSCTTQCKTNVCGDGFVNTGIEQCDLGNANGFCPSLCSSGCLQQSCTPFNLGDKIIFNYSNFGGNSNGVTNLGNGNYNWQIPNAIKKIQVEVIGGGGGGGSRSIGNRNGGGGGGGGYALSVIDVQSNQNYSIEIGLGGRGGGGGPGNDGRNGEDSLFSNKDLNLDLVFSEGGVGGREGRNGGNGGVGGIATGQVTLRGGLGGKASTNANGCGSGGLGGTIPGNAGGDGINNSGGGGGASKLGVGGNGGNGSLTTGQSGKSPGGGGGGGASMSSSCQGSTGNSNGGDGGNGQIIITILEVEGMVQETPNNCPANQTIFTLYSSSNSHAALWDNESASYKICYEQLFGVHYSGNNPHACTVNNQVITLSDNNNAHAGNNYNINVCYGNLDCEVRSSCQVGEVALARLTGTTNAHVANSTFTDYPYALCCSSNQDVGSFISARWESANIEITNAGKYQNVQLVAQTNFSAGTKVVYEIFEEDGLLDDNIKTGVNNITGIVDINGKVNVSWYINDSDIQNGDNTGEGNELEFYFKASALGKQITSSNLITSKVIILNPNNCNVELSGVVNGGIYLINSQINLSHTSNVASQTIWQVVESGLSYNSNSVILNLTESGQRTINLIVKIPGCADQIRQSAFLVLDSGNKQYLFISKPFAGQIIPLGNKSSIQVDYSAEGSYIINSSIIGCSGTISCLAGVCPSTTSGTPNGCSNLPITNSPQPYNLINFSWKEVTKDGEKQNFVSGLGEVSGSRTLFSSSYSRKVNDYAFKVTANYSQSGISVQQSFVRNFTFGECIDRGYNYTLQNQGVLQSVLGTTNYSSSLTNFNSQACRGIDGLAGNKDDCCPSGYICSDTGCVPKSESAPIRCEDYTTQAECEADSLGLWRYQTSSQPNTCSNTGNSISTICGWTPGIGCGLKTVLNSETTETGSCFEQAKNITSCVNGYYQINVTAIPTSGLNSCLECQSGVYVAPCGRPAFELPVFGIWQLILSLICILAIYMLIRRFY